MTNLSKSNALLNSANILETLLKNVLFCDLMTAFARFPKYWLSLTLSRPGFQKLAQAWGGDGIRPPPNSTPFHLNQTKFCMGKRNFI